MHERICRLIRHPRHIPCIRLTRTSVHSHCNVEQAGIAMIALVTGGAGFIGTHTLVELHRSGLPYVVVDNLSNSSARALAAVSRITGAPVPFVRGDVKDSALIASVLKRLTACGETVTVIHFAALKSVAESVADPTRYFDNNITGTLKLLQSMHAAGVHNLIFSSSATVYGEPRRLPFDESHRIAPTNPYGHTKAIAERILSRWAAMHSGNKVLSLRYFNPVGAHPSGLIGEDPHGMPNNLFPCITRVAHGKLSHLDVYGDDYPTVDGTGVRDYVHVVDLARAHAQALDYVAQNQPPGFQAMNLGTGKGTSVMELVHAFERASGVRVPVRLAPRGAGDVASMWADPSLAERTLHWQAERSLAAMCEDGWRWQLRNPDGFQESASSVLS